MPETPAPLRRILYIAGTHWDREWYRPYEAFRFRLVSVIDEVLDTLEADPSFSTFLLDGQSILAEDYLEIRPENRARLSGLLAGGRLSAGPWFTMPDQFLVSGEGLVRNLALGIRTVQGLGGDPLRCGFVCDIFGHAAQLPQVLRGFGIRSALLGRGTNAATTPAHFLWESPDGTRCLAYKVPESVGYGIFFWEVLSPFLSGSDPDEDRLLERAAAHVEAERRRSPVPVVLLMDNMDHERIHAVAPRLADALSRRFGCPVAFEPPDRLPELLEDDFPVLPVIRGELSETGQAQVLHHMLITHTLSSRPDIKGAYDRAQSLLEHWAEPLSWMAALAGNPLPRGFLDRADRLLVENQAHDSICGCSVDAVYRDMHHRLDHVRQVCDEFRYEACRRLAAGSVSTGGVGPDPVPGEHRLTLWNPLPIPFHGVAETDLFFSPDFPARFQEQVAAEERNAFRIVDPEGREVPYGLLGIRRNATRVPFDPREMGSGDVHRISLIASVPALGSVTYRILPSDRPVRHLDRIRVDGRTMDNGRLRVTLQGDGTLSLEDLATGRRFDGLLEWRDNGEIGDGWHHLAPLRDVGISSLGQPARIEFLSNTPAACTARISWRMEIPEDIVVENGERIRSGTTRPLSLSAEIRLGREDRFVDVAVQVDNRHRDHRLKLLFPTGIDHPEYRAGSAFCFVTRTTGRDLSTADWKEVAKPERAFDGAVLKRHPADGQGLAILSAHGVHEVEGMDDRQGTLALTLLRCFRQVFGTDGEEGGQVPGLHAYRFRLVPLDADIREADLVRSLQALRAGLYSQAVPAAGPFGQDAPAPAMAGLLTVRSTACVATRIARAAPDPVAGEEADRDLVLRLCNYSDQADDAAVQCAFPILDAWPVDFLDQPLSDPEDRARQEPPERPEPDALRIRLEPWQVRTLRIRPGTRE